MIKERYAMTAPKSMDPAQFLREQAVSAEPDVLRAMVKTFAEALMSAEADAVCGAGYGVRDEAPHESAERVPGPGVGHPGGQH
jgi:transposase-like protein